MQVAETAAHHEHQLARLFVLCAVAQIAAGLIAWAYPSRLAAGIIVGINAAAVSA